MQIFKSAHKIPLDLVAWDRPGDWGIARDRPGEGGGLKSFLQTKLKGHNCNQQKEITLIAVSPLS